ncbi:hypothetical protein AB0K18_05565 [Nonomuraea sp. NPDC049421]|uniref:hypothetical protein n=1 Tax=Nonomuraea sp. NPDC049421 TaxID=3155275 RepID=UPI00344801DE
MRAQTRADRIPTGIAPPETTAAEQQTPQVAADGRRPVPAPADAGDNGGDERRPPAR